MHVCVRMCEHAYVRACLCNLLSIYVLQGVIHELNKNCDVMKLVANSLVKCHKQAVAVAGDTCPLNPNTLVDGRYTHADVSNKREGIC